MRTDHRRDLGRAGEDLAVRLLEEHGLRVLDRNWRDGRRGELDIVAYDDACGQVVVVEVRTRTGDLRGSALESVDVRKFARLRRLAASWLRAHDTHGEVRFDIVAVTVPRIRDADEPVDLADAATGVDVDWVSGVVA